MEILLEDVVVYFHVHVNKHFKASDSRTHNSRMSLNQCLDEDEETNEVWLHARQHCKYKVAVSGEVPWLVMFSS